MAILGAVVRTLPQHLTIVLDRLTSLPGVNVALNPGDGRLVLVMEDVEQADGVHSAAATLTDIAMWARRRIVFRDGRIVEDREQRPRTDMAGAAA